MLCTNYEITTICFIITHTPNTSLRYLSLHEVSVPVHDVHVQYIFHPYHDIMFPIKMLL